MRSTMKKLLAMALCLVMVATLLPAMAVTSKAAGVAPSAGVLLFEENFDYASYADMKTAGWTFPNAKTDLSNAATYYVLSDGYITYKANSSTTYYTDYTVSGLNIAAGAAFCIEYGVYAPSGSSNNYQMCPTSLTDGATITVGDTDATANPKFGMGVTGSAGFETHYQYWTVSDNALKELKLRVGSYKGSNTGTVQFDYVKLYLVADPATALAEENGFAVLTENVSVTGALTLGKNASLDLNGYTLTATAVNGGENARIIDSSADRSGVLATEDLALDNASNPQLPLKTSQGYIFTEPKLNEEDVKRAIMSGISENGFTLDFRPGFGEDIRVNHLAAGTSGITMTANLSWTDKDGFDGALANPINATEIFNGMYASATHRGRLILTGAEGYQKISLTLTLSSCGVTKTFEPIVFGKTVHFAADFENGLTVDIGTLGANTNSAVVENSDGNHVLNAREGNTLTFAETIAPAAARKLIIEFEAMTETGDDYFSIRYKRNDQYLVVLGTNGITGGGANSDICPGSNSKFRLTKGESAYSKIRMTIDLESGAWEVYQDGTRVRQGTYSDSANSETIAQILSDRGSFQLRCEGGDGRHFFDNIMIYTVGDMS